MGPDAMIFTFLMLSFKAAFSLSSLTLSRGPLVPLHFLQLGWYHLHVWGCWYFPGNLDSSLCPTFHMIYSAFKLNKQGDNIQPCHTPFPILNQSVVPCLALTAASWPTHRFLRRQVGLVFPSLRIFQFVVIHIIKGFSIVNEVGVDVCLELPSLLHVQQYLRWELKPFWRVTQFSWVSPKYTSY